MRLSSLIVGSIFCDLLQHGKEIESAIARKDASLLNHSTPELERYFDRPSAELPRQNAFPVAVLLLLLLLAFAFNLLPFLHALPNLTPPAHALSFFAPSLLMIVAVLACSLLMARGFTAGLAGLRYLFIVLLVITIAQLLVKLLPGGGSWWPLAIALLALLGSRIVLNGQAFVLFAIYCRTRRIAALARQIRC